MQPHGKALLIRADAGVRIGSGHVMRCLALGQAWQETAGHATILSCDLAPALRRRLAEQGMDIVDADSGGGGMDDARAAIALAERLGAAWVVVDGYHFGADYQKAIKDAGLRLLFIDDNGHADHYFADLVLNQNIHAHEGLYADRDPDTQLLLGTRYAMIRREFWPWRRWRRQAAPTARKVLVTLGGSDPDNVTLKVIEALGHWGAAKAEAIVVVGGGNPHWDSISAAVDRSPIPIRLLRDVSDMPNLMVWAETAVAGGGSTNWELALMELPAIVVVLADNQAANCRQLARAGVVINLGWHADLAPRALAGKLRDLAGDVTRRSEMSARGRNLVDGYGGQRVAAEMRAKTSVRVRPATTDDARILFDWCNDPLVRGMSFNSKEIQWSEHLAWLDKTLGSAGVQLLIAEADDGGCWAPAGQVRFDADGAVSISLAAAQRGKELALPVLLSAIRRHRLHWPDTPLTAYIKPDNAASLALFAAGGFRDAGPAEVRGQPCLRFILAPADLE